MPVVKEAGEAIQGWIPGFHVALPVIVRKSDAEI